MSRELEKSEERVEKLSSRVKSLSQRVNEEAKKAQGMLTKLVAAFSIEAFDLREKAEVAGVDGLITIGLAAFGASQVLDGDAADMAANVAETCGILYAAEAGREHRDGGGADTPAT